MPAQLEKLREVLDFLSPGHTAKWPEPLDEPPEIDQLEEWGNDGVVEATDGCRVEPDGICEHGHPSWFLYMGII